MKANRKDLLIDIMNQMKKLVSIIQDEFQFGSH